MSAPALYLAIFLCLAAAVCFAVASASVPTGRINLMAVGLFLLAVVAVIVAWNALPAT